MPEQVEKRDMSLDDLIERTEEAIRDAVKGNTLSDEEAIRERIEEYRQKS